MRAGKAEDGSKHSEACRKRIEAEMRREHDPRIKRAEDKHTHFEEEVLRAKEAIDKKAKKAARSRRGGAEADDGDLQGQGQDSEHDDQARSSSDPPPGKVPRGDAPEGEPGLTGDLQTIKDATARAGDDEPGTLRKFMKPGSVWKASTDSSSTAKSSTSAMCEHACSSTSLAKTVLRPSVEGKHVSSTSPAADPLGKVLHHGFEGKRVWGEDHISTAEEEDDE